MRREKKSDIINAPEFCVIDSIKQDLYLKKKGNILKNNKNTHIKTILNVCLYTNFGQVSLTVLKYVRYKKKYNYVIFKIILLLGWHDSDLRDA